MPKEKENEIELVELRNDNQRDIENVLEHSHTGSDTPQISFNNLNGLIETTDEFWTRHVKSKPKDISQQIKLSVSGTTASLCIYNNKLNDWRCVQLSV